VAFLTNEFELEPRLIAFLSSRRWEEEKCFATWKNRVVPLDNFMIYKDIIRLDRPD